jgi:hypothetical protein
MPKKVSIEEYLKLMGKEFDKVAKVLNAIRSCEICGCMVHEDAIEHHLNWHMES